MRAFPCLLTAALLLTSVASAQDATPTLRTGVRLTTVDVVVVDGHGNPVTGLKADDFAVREAKQPQRINGFEEHSGSSVSYSKPKPGTFTNATTARGGASTVLLIDWLNTPAADQQYMRDQLTKFVETQKPGSQTAIFTLGTSVRLLQNFTTDEKLLKAAILKQGTKYSPTILAQPQGMAPEVQALEAMVQSSATPEIAAMLEGIQQSTVDFNKIQSAQLRRLQSQLTMAGLRDIARYLSGVNGRKNLLWVTESFPMVVPPDPNNTSGHPFQPTEDMTRELIDTTNLLASSQIAVYPVDPRGLQTPDMPAQGTGNLVSQQRMQGTTNMMPQITSFDNQLFQQHATMEDIAADTGGQAIFNTNDVSGALQQAMRHGSQYYTLSYTPPAAVKPGDFRLIDVTVKGKGMHVSYRRGYYAKPALTKPTTGTAASVSLAMRAMSPQSSEVLFDVTPVPGNTQDMAKAIGAKIATGAPNLYQLNAAVDISTIRFEPTADGKMHSIINFATVLYDAKGKVIDSHSDRADLTLDPSRYDAMLQGGLRFHHVVALPASGDYFVRMAVHDATTDRVGTVQMTAAEIRKAGS